MSEIRFTKDHEWARREADDVVTIGITDYAQQQLGELVHVELPDEGTSFARGDEVAVVESVKAAGEIKSPVGGAITEINQTLTENPGTVNEDAAGTGWLYKIKMDDATEFDQLMDEAAYEKLIEEAE